MKKTAIAILTVFAFTRAFAECDSMPYNAPEELQPQCEQQSDEAGPSSGAVDAKTTKAEKSEKASIPVKPSDQKGAKVVRSISNVDQR